MREQVYFQMIIMYKNRETKRYFTDIKKEKSEIKEKLEEVDEIDKK